MLIGSGLPSGAPPSIKAVPRDPGPAVTGAIDWDGIPESLQVMLAGAALRRALVTAARHAEALAGAMENGTLQDCGGPDALRLFAAIMNVTAEDGLGGVCLRDILVA